MARSYALLLKVLKKMKEKEIQRSTIFKEISKSTSNLSISIILHKKPLPHYLTILSFTRNHFLHYLTILLFPTHREQTRKVCLLITNIYKSTIKELPHNQPSKPFHNYNILNNHQTVPFIHPSHRQNHTHIPHLSPPPKSLSPEKMADKRPCIPPQASTTEKPQPTIPSPPPFHPPRKLYHQPPGTPSY